MLLMRLVVGAVVLWHAGEEEGARQARQSLGVGVIAGVGVGLGVGVGVFVGVGVDDGVGVGVGVAAVAAVLDQLLSPPVPRALTR